MYNMSDLIKLYLTIDQNYFKNTTLQNPFIKKEELFTILKWWKTLSRSETIGDLAKINGNTPLIKIKLGSIIYVINGDTTKQGVQTFLSNKNNSWNIIENENRIKNKITNDLNKEPIKGFYMYKI